MKEPIAHVTEDGREHTLKDHLEGTAKLASTFAAEFGCGIIWGIGDNAIKQVIK